MAGVINAGQSITGGANHPSPSYKAVNPIALSTDKPDTQRICR